MNVPYLESLITDIPPRLLMVGQDESHLNELVTFFLHFRNDIGVLDNLFPFLSNLNILENILLPTMYRHNLPPAKARERIENHIQALNLASWMSLRKEQLAPHTLILCQLLRCLACEDSIILLPSAKIATAETVITAIAKLRVSLTLWILCIKKNAVAYEKFGFPTCYIER